LSRWPGGAPSLFGRKAPVGDECIVTCYVNIVRHAHQNVVAEVHAPPLEESPSSERDAQVVCHTVVDVTLRHLQGLPQAADARAEALTGA